jgi:disulfide bond formation protein DsbB
MKFLLRLADFRFFLSSTLLLGLVSALILQHLLGWAPCAMCIVQRLTVLGMFVFALPMEASPLAGRQRLVARCGVLLFASVGTATALAHFWLFVSPVPTSCGPGLAHFFDRLVEELPGSSWFLQGAGPCDDVRYQVLGVPLPLFSALLHILAVVFAFRKNAINAGAFWSQKKIDL